MKDKWDESYLMTSTKSPLIKLDLVVCVLPGLYEAFRCLTSIDGNVLETTRASGSMGYP